MSQKWAVDYGLTVGTLPRGGHNRIADVPGVTVGHCTVDNETHKTGAMVILPMAENPFLNKLPAAPFVLNGYGKTAGLVQVSERETFAAIEAAGYDFDEGDVGYSKGMICHGLKGGVDTAFRLLDADGRMYTLGCWFRQTTDFISVSPDKRKLRLRSAASYGKLLQSQ